MIDVSRFTPCRVGDLTPGQLFLPAGRDTDYFVSGRINQIPVLVCLIGERPFVFAQTEQWRRAPGFAINDIIFEVDPLSAILADEETTRGSLMRSRAATVLLASNAEHRDGPAYPIYFEAGDNQTDVQRGDIAFTRWQIMSGPQPHGSVLFSADVTAAA